MLRPSKQSKAKHCLLLRAGPTAAGQQPPCGAGKMPSVLLLLVNNPQHPPSLDFTPSVGRCLLFEEWSASNSMTEHHEWSRHTGLHTNSHTRPITDIIVAPLTNDSDLERDPQSGNCVTTVCRIVPPLPMRPQLQVPTLFVLFAPARHVKCDRCEKKVQMCGQFEQSH